MPLPLLRPFSERLLQIPSNFRSMIAKTITPNNRQKTIYPHTDLIMNGMTIRYQNANFYRNGLHFRNTGQYSDTFVDDLLEDTAPSSSSSKSSSPQMQPSISITTSAITPQIMALEQEKQKKRREERILHNRIRIKLSGKLKLCPSCSQNTCSGKQCRPCHFKMNNKKAHQKLIQKKRTELLQIQIPNAASADNGGSIVFSDPVMSISDYDYTSTSTTTPTPTENSFNPVSPVACNSPVYPLPKSPVYSPKSPSYTENNSSNSLDSSYNPVSPAPLSPLRD
jgi:hypothetical protein